MKVGAEESAASFWIKPKLCAKVSKALHLADLGCAGLAADNNRLSGSQRVCGLCFSIISKVLSSTKIYLGWPKVRHREPAKAGHGRLAHLVINSAPQADRHLWTEGKICGLFTEVVAEKTAR